MVRFASTRPLWSSHRGFGLVEIMVGLVIGFIAVLVIYQVYTISEGFKRNTTAAGEAQQTGLFSAFMLGMELGNAGAGIAAASQALVSCSDPGSAVSMPKRFAQSWRPLPVVVADSGNSSTPDTFVVSYSMASTIASSGLSQAPGAALFTAPALAGSPFQVASPGAFHQNDLVVGIKNPGPPTGSTPCATSKITAAPALTNDVQGDVTLTQTPVDPPGGIDFDGSQSALFNLGPCDRVQKVMYSLAFLNDAVGNKSKWNYHPACGPLAPCVLYSTPLLQTGNNCGQPADPFIGNPVAANIINLKVQYGIDTNNDAARTLDTWVPATGAWSWDTLMQDGTTVQTIGQIKAVRIGIIVQSEQFDQTLGDYNWVMFDCAAANKANCPGRLTGTIAAQTTPPTGNWRYRKYETVIPLRNSIWNRF